LTKVDSPGCALLDHGSKADHCPTAAHDHRPAEVDRQHARGGTLPSPWRDKSQGARCRLVLDLTTLNVERALRVSHVRLDPGEWR